MTYTGGFRLTNTRLVLYCMYKLNKRAKQMIGQIKKHLINGTSTTLSVVALVGTLAFAAPAKAGGDDIVKVLGAIMIFQQLFDNDDDRYYNGQNNGQRGYNGYGNNRVYDDSGRYERTCNDNLGCAARDNNRWNDPRGYGYAQGRNSNGAPNGRVCGQRSQRVDQWTTETLHLDCNGNVMYVTRHNR